MNASTPPSPDEIRDKTFRKGFRGYKKAQVRAYLKDVAALVQELLEEGWRREEHIARLAAQLTAADEREAEWQRLADELQIGMDERLSGEEQEKAEFSRRPADVLRNAKTEANLIVQEADEKARKVFARANEKIHGLKGEIELLQERKRALVSRLRTLLASQQEFLASLDAEGAQPPRNSAILTDDEPTREGIGSDEIRAIIQKLDDRQQAT